MLVICRGCKSTQFHRAKYATPIKDTACRQCGRVGLNKLNAEENAAREAVNGLAVAQNMALMAASAAPSDRKLLEEIHEMLRLSLSAQLVVLPGRRIALKASRPRLTLLRGGLAATGRAA